MSMPPSDATPPTVVVFWRIVVAIGKGYNASKLRVNASLSSLRSKVSICLSLSSKVISPALVKSLTLAILLGSQGRNIW